LGRAGICTAGKQGRRAIVDGKLEAKLWPAAVPGQPPKAAWRRRD
jgi:hypothetical protein